MPSIKLENLNLTLGKNRIIKNLSLDIADGEYFSLVGETGAGKTSILNMISGLLKPDSGKIIIGQEDFTSIKAEDRDVGQVFEDYALFPHYTVYKNVIYSHRVHDRDPDMTRKAARGMLNLMLLVDRDDAMPGELSGGMQQRVALARSLMTNSGVLLLDDPFSALDAGLRMNLRIELKNLSKRLGTTIVHCTNDIEEAMIVGNRMAILRDGGIEQVGTPDEIYTKPSNLYVLSFLGDVNYIPCKVRRFDESRGFIYLVHKRGEKSREFRVNDDAAKNRGYREGDDVWLCVRAEHFHMYEGYRKKPNRMKGIIDEVSFLGHLIRYEIINEFGELIKVQRFVNEKTKEKKYLIGENITLNFRPRHGYLFDPPTGEELKQLQNI
ncbi:MAG: ABC transporter ATP-binding protein [Promethearchaeota archaeon]